MKNKMIVGGFLLMSFAAANAEPSYTDTIKSSIDAHAFHLDRWNTNVRSLGSDIMNVNSIPLYISATNMGLKSVGKKSEKLEKIIQYNAWYNPHHKLYAIDDKGEFKRYNYANRELFEKAVVAEVVEPAIFLVADYGIEKLVRETETGKAIVQNIPEPHYQFVEKNGKIVLSALVARSCGTLIKGESLSQNAQAFGKSTFVHLGSKGLEEYVINPRIDEYMGPEGDYLKESARFIAKLSANGLAMYGLHVGLNVGLKMLGASAGPSRISDSADYKRIESQQDFAYSMYNIKLRHESYYIQMQNKM